MQPALTHGWLIQYNCDNMRYVTALVLIILHIWCRDSVNSYQQPEDLLCRLLLLLHVIHEAVQFTVHSQRCVAA